MLYTELIKKAMQIAFDAHFGQTDRCGVPYICHPLTVAAKMPDETKIVIAILHDVLEDTSLTAEDLLQEGIPQSIVESVLLLTRDKTIPYANYIEKIISSKNIDALMVKLGDLSHNLDPVRRKECNLPRHLVERYELAQKMIGSVLEAQ